MHIKSFLALSLFLILAPWHAYAQVSTLDDADKQVNTFMTLYNSGVSNAAMYDSLYNAYQQYATLCLSATPNERGMNGLRTIYPFLEEGTIFYSSNENAIRALDFALAYIKIPQMEVFKNEQFNRSANYPRVCYFAATTSYNNRRYNDAILCFRSYIETNDKDKQKESYLYLSQSYKRLNKHQQQLEVIDEALSKYPQTQNYIYDAINTCVSLGNIDGIDKYTDMALAINPNDAKVLPIRAKMLGMKEDYANAYSIYERLYSVNPNDIGLCKDYATVAYNYAGSIINECNKITDGTLIAQKRGSAEKYLKTAAQLFERIIAATPNEAKYMLALLDTYKMLGMEAEANNVAAKIQMMGLATNVPANQEPTAQESVQQTTTSQASIAEQSNSDMGISLSEVPSFSSFAKARVEAAINKWQLKDDYETMAEYRERVTEETRNEKIKEFAKEAEIDYIAKYSPNIKFDNLRLGKYDAEHGVFLVSSPSLGNMLLPVPRQNNEARNFEASWKSVKATNAKYGIVNDKMVLTSLTFLTAQGKEYTFNNDTSLTYQKTHVDYNFESISLASLTDQNKDNPSPTAQNIVEDSIVAGKSDIDLSIPVNKHKNENLFAVIIANENYKRVPSVKYAANDGETMQQYCLKTLGCPNDNVRLIKDATLNDMIDAIDWLTLVANAYDGAARMIFYYAGHGIPNEATKSAFLMPTDGFATNTGTCYSLDKLYEKLGELPVEQMTVLLDACFSGSQRGNETLSANARGVEIEPKSSEPVGNMVVMTAASGSETAYPYEEQKHGLFTYYLLRKLKESKGKVRLGELAEYIKTNVAKKSVIENKKSQTPSCTVSNTIELEWEKWKFVD